MRDTNKLTAYAKEMAYKAKENLLHKLLRREVNVGGNGTQQYVLKNGPRAGKIADKDSFQ